MDPRPRRRRRGPGLTLFRRFFLILLAFSLLPAAGAALWALSTSRAAADNARFLHGRLAVLAAESAQRTIAEAQRALDTAQDVEFARGREEIEIAALQRAAAADPEVALLSILDASGAETRSMADPEVFAERARPDLARGDLAAEASRGGRLAVGAPMVAAGRALLRFAHPLSDGRTLYMVYSLRGLERRLRSFAGGGSGRLLFVDGAGRPIAGLGGAPPSPDWRLGAAGGAEGWEDRLPSASGPWIAASAPVAALGWRAVSLQPRRDAYAETDAASERAAAFFLGLIGISAAAAFALSEFLLRPLEALVAGARRAARGDFSTPVPPLGWGELDGLGRTFNAMADKMRHYRALQVERILEEKAKVDALVSNIPGAVILVGADGAVAFANAEAARILGVNSGSRRGPLAPRFPEIQGLVNSVRRGAQPSAECRIETRSAGEAAAAYCCRAAAVRRGGREAGAVVLMREVTAEVELERMKEEFFQALVHDLRGPLGVLDGVVSVIDEARLGAREARYVDLARRASRRLQQMVANILDIAKLESGAMRVFPRKVAADSLLCGAREMHRPAAERKGVTLEVEPSAAGELVADAALLDRVLANLVGNALKFTPGGGRVALGASAAGAEVEFFVRDTGPGIPAGHLDEVFEKFKQLDRDAAARSGYGLGLSICRKIVESHGGRIWAESSPGRGSRFAFRLPREGPPGVSSRGAGC